MRLALAQINPVVGDLDGNGDLILGRLADAKANGADLVLFPELAVTGYPPEDLLLRPGFVRAAERRVEEIAREARGTTVLVGAPHFDRDLFNACFVLSGGEDELIFDGHSVVIDDEGAVLTRAPGFEEALLVVDIDPKEVIGRRLSDVRRRALAREREEVPRVEVIHVGAAGPSSDGNKATGAVAPFVDELEQMRLALELGLHDYVR